MSGNEALLLVIEALDAMGIDYVVVGSYASNTYGIERSTVDADLVVDLADASPAELFRRLRPGIRFDPQMSFETVTITCDTSPRSRVRPSRSSYFTSGTTPTIGNVSVAVERSRRRGVA